MGEGKTIWKEGISPEEMCSFLEEKNKPPLSHFWEKSR